MSNYYLYYLLLILLKISLLPLIISSLKSVGSIGDDWLAGRPLVMDRNEDRWLTTSWLHNKITDSRMWSELSNKESERAFEGRISSVRSRLISAWHQSRHIAVWPSESFRDERSLVEMCVRCEFASWLQVWYDVYAMLIWRHKYEVYCRHFPDVCLLDGKTHRDSMQDGWTVSPRFCLSRQHSDVTVSVLRLASIAEHIIWAIRRSWEGRKVKGEEREERARRPWCQRKTPNR